MRSPGAKARAAAVVAALTTALALAGCGSSAGGGGKQLLVWVDQTRTPGVHDYMKAHPDADIRLVTIPNTVGYLQGKISLDNKAKGGWPDVVFINSPSDIAALSSSPFDYAAPLNDLVSDDLRSKFADGALEACTFGGKLYCLRNDIGQTVLWYNKKLMAQFGYQVPSTWAEYQQLGEQVAKDHPGYVVGQVNGKFGADVYFEASRCPTREVVDATTVHINTSDPKCTRVAQLLEPLFKNKTVLTLAPSDPAYVQIGNKNKILMMPGASWYGDFLFKPTFKTPAGQLAAALMPTWPGESTPYAGAVGGGMFAISRHGSTDKQRDAADLITWMTTNVAHQKAQPTYPAFTPAATAWCQAKASDTFYAADPCPVLEQEAPLIAKSHGMVSYQPEWVNTFNETVVAAGQSGKSLDDALSQWGERLVQAAKQKNYTVVTDSQ